MCQERYIYIDCYIREIYVFKYIYLIPLNFLHLFFSIQKFLLFCPLFDNWPSATRTGKKKLLAILTLGWDKDGEIVTVGESRVERDESGREENCCPIERILRIEIV